MTVHYSSKKPNPLRWFWKPMAKDSDRTLRTLVYLFAGLGAVLVFGGGFNNYQQAQRRAEIAEARKAREADPELAAAHRAKIVAQQDAAKERQDARGFDATEAREFKAAIDRIDPNKVLVQKMEIDRSVVYVTGTNTLFLQSDLQLSEFLINYKAAGHKVCDCSPLVVLKTQSGQTVAKTQSFGNGVDIKIKNR